MKYLKLIALFTVIHIHTHAYGQILDSEKPHYFDKYIEGVFKTIENPPAECLKFLEISNESKMLANKDILACYTLIENEIPKQLKFDILSYRPKEKLRAEAIKNQAIFGTCYRKDSSSKYYDTSYAELDVKPNKSYDEMLYIDNINSHCNTLHMMQLETDNILKDIKKKKAKRKRTTLSTIGSLAIAYVVVTIGLIIYINYTGVG